MWSARTGTLVWPPRPGRNWNRPRLLEAAETVVYLGIAALLVAASFVLLGVAAKDLADVIDDFGTNPVVEALNTLLLLFILVELLAAVRITISKRELGAGGQAFANWPWRHASHSVSDMTIGSCSSSRGAITTK